MRYAVSRGAFVAVASGNTRDDGNQPNRLAQLAPDINGMVAVGAVGRTLELAYYSTTGLVRRALRARRRSATGRRTGGGILQQTLDLDLLETFERPPSQFGPPRADAFVYLPFQGTSMADAACLGVRRAADAARDHQPGGDRSRDEAVRDRQGARRAGTIRSATV